MRVFLSTPLEDSRRLHLRHLARGINYRGGFTPVTILPDRYPPSIRIKAGEGGAFQGSIPRGARTPRASRNTSTSCSPLLRLSSPSLLPPTIRYQALPRLMQILRKLLALRAFVSPRLYPFPPPPSSTNPANLAETIPRETRLS